MRKSKPSYAALMREKHALGRELDEARRERNELLGRVNTLEEAYSTQYELVQNNQRQVVEQKALIDEQLKLLVGLRKEVDDKKRALDYAAKRMDEMSQEGARQAETNCVHEDRFTRIIKLMGDALEAERGTPYSGSNVTTDFAR